MLDGVGLLFLLLFQFGIRDMFDREYGIVTLCRAIDPKNKVMMTDTVKLVAAVCLIGDGSVTF